MNPILIYTKKTVIILSLSSILIACGHEKEEVKTDATTKHHEESSVVSFTDAQYKTVGIELGYITNRVLSGTIRVNGKLDVPPQQLISISVPVGGFLKSTELLQGSYVKKGQVMAMLESQDYIELQQSYLDAKSQLEYAEADYQRQQQLANENANAQKTLQQAKANYFTLKSKVGALNQKLKLLNISTKTIEQRGIQSTITLYAPISGYVTEVNGNIGKHVSPTDVLFEIVDTEHLHAELTVYEKDVPKLKIGQRVRFTLANETKERIARVYLIGRKISNERTVQIHCHIDKVDKEMLPGMFLTAFVESGGQNLPSLPDEAIVSFEGKKYAFITTDQHQNKQQSGEHHFEIIPIQTGISEQGYTEVILPPSINNTTHVVTKGAYSLLSKMKNSEEE